MARSPPEGRKLTPAVIETAPDSIPTPAGETSAIPDHPIWDLVRDLQIEVESLKADNDRLTAETDPAIVKARLLKPYANRVFWFLVLYTAFVFAILLADGFKVFGFLLPDSVLSVLAGTSFVAVAGLIGPIVSGLFSSK